MNIDEYIKIYPEYKKLIQSLKTYCKEQLEIEDDEMIIRIFEKSKKMLKKNCNELFEIIIALAFTLKCYYGRDFQPILKKLFFNL